MFGYIDSISRNEMAAVFTEPVGDPDHPGTCFIREQGIRVKDGHTWDMPGCMGAACYGTGEDMTIEYYTCGSIAVSKPCFVSQDMSKPYPDCCGEIFCPHPQPRAERSAEGSDDHP